MKFKLALPYSSLKMKMNLLLWQIQSNSDSMLFMRSK